MDSFDPSSGFTFNPNSTTMGGAEGDSDFSGILEIYVHHARNIHNICIYENQDVYAKFSLTYNPDETLSTRIIDGGGKNPEFDERLMMEVTQNDAVLKCEIWMLSRVRNYLEDQLLGFALVPVSQIVGKGKVTEDYSLSSTDLFHSPAGTVKLTLSLDAVNSSVGESNVNSSSISSEVVLLDRKISEVILDPVEYSRIEFPDMKIVKENQQMVSEYFSGLNSAEFASFLRLGASPHQVDDCEMTIIASSEDIHGGSISPNDSVQNSGFLSSTTTSLSDDRNSADSLDKTIINHSSRLTSETNQSLNGASPDTPTSKKETKIRDEKDKEDETKNNKVKFGQVFTAPLGNINLEAEQSAMQQQIVDMYMRSMQQFTESLAKMKLPMDLDKPPRREDREDLIQSQTSNELDGEKTKKKDGSRVFYGSRAFF